MFLLFFCIHGGFFFLFFFFYLLLFATTIFYVRIVLKFEIMSHPILYITVAQASIHIHRLHHTRTDTTQHLEIDVIQRYNNRALENLSTMCGP